jgi:hypothetical protein
MSAYRCKGSGGETGIRRVKGENDGYNETKLSCEPTHPIVVSIAVVPVVVVAASSVRANM